MHCSGCGCVLQDGERFCPGCGKPVSAIAPPPARVVASGAPMYVAGAHPSGKATASLICGIFFFLFPLPIFAVVLGHMALAEIKRSAGRLIGEGRAIAGLVLGYFGLLSAIPILLAVAAIAIPSILRARMAANEASAVASVRAINTAERAFSAEYANVGYACDLYQLGGNAKAPTSVGAGYIDNLLASGTKNEYNFRIAGCRADSGPATKYVIYATPQQQGTTGRRTFCSDQDGEIKALNNASGEACMEYGTPIS